MWAERTIPTCFRRGECRPLFGRRDGFQLNRGAGHPPRLLAGRDAKGFLRGVDAPRIPINSCWFMALAIVATVLGAVVLRGDYSRYQCSNYLVQCGSQRIRQSTHHEVAALSQAFEFVERVVKLVEAGVHWEIVGSMLLSLTSQGFREEPKTVRLLLVDFHLRFT